MICEFWLYLTQSQYPSCVLFAYIYVFVCNEFPFDDTWKQSTTRTHKWYWAVFRRIRIEFIHFQIKAQKHRNSIFEYKTKPMPLSLLLLLLKILVEFFPSLFLQADFDFNKKFNLIHLFFALFHARLGTCKCDNAPAQYMRLT